jgi:ribosomal protein S18 acetylase RimI-like enzyme
MNATEEARVYPSRREEREAIAAVARSTGVFSPAEIDTVFELFDGYVNNPASGYEFLSAEIGGRLAGFVCWGPTPLTEGTCDLYWLSTDAAFQRRGVGRALCGAVEREARKRNGRMIVIWTSGTGAYLPATRLYERMGCMLNSRIRDYYKPGDDLLVYVKYLT